MLCRSEQHYSKLMEKNVSPSKSVNKPPLLPKPKIIVVPRKSVKKYTDSIAQDLSTSIQTSVLLIKETTSYEKTNSEISFNCSHESILQSIDGQSINGQSIDGQSIDGLSIDSQSIDGQSFLHSNESEISGDKESDSDLTDSTSQKSIDASLTVLSNCENNETEAFLIAKELATSEQVYIDALHLIVYRFKNYLEEYNKNIGGSKVIPDHELAKIISSLPQLLRLNEDLYDDLKYRIDNWSEHPKIADVIIKKGPFLKLYTTYIKEFESVCNYLEECRSKYPRFADALNEFESLSVCKNLNLKHYMLKPVQRIPQYRLLIQNYLNHVKVGSEEHTDATKALQIIHEVLNHTNDTLNLDNLSKLLQIQSKLGDHEIIKPGRKFLKEGELYKLCRKEMQLRFFILMNDCLLCTTNVTLSILKVKYELPLLGMKVETNCLEKYEFSIITSRRSFTLRARSSEEYCEWVELLHTSIDEINQKQLTFNSVRSVESPDCSGTLRLGQEAPIWIQDKRTTMCQICTAEFTMTFRRHHCRCCGKVVCSYCSSNKAPLAYLKFQSARVCKLCYDYLLKEMNGLDKKLIEIVKSSFKLEDREASQFLNAQLGAFKKFDCTGKSKKFIPQRLKEVAGNELGDITTSGWLMRRGRRGWKRLWFVLKASVLYEYKASHDLVAHRSLPVLGYTVSRLPSGFSDECESNLAFSLNHPGQSSLVFMALSQESVDLWLKALTEATVLK